MNSAPSAILTGLSPAPPDSISNSSTSSEANVEQFASVIGRAMDQSRSNLPETHKNPGPSNEDTKESEANQSAGDVQAPLAEALPPLPVVESHLEVPSLGSNVSEDNAHTADQGALISATPPGKGLTQAGPGSETRPGHAFKLRPGTVRQPAQLDASQIARNQPQRVPGLPAQITPAPLHPPTAPSDSEVATNSPHIVIPNAEAVASHGAAIQPTLPNAELAATGNPGSSATATPLQAARTVSSNTQDAPGRDATFLVPRHFAASSQTDASHSEPEAPKPAKTPAAPAWSAPAYGTRYSPQRAIAFSQPTASTRENAPTPQDHIAGTRALPAHVISHSPDLKISSPVVAESEATANRLDPNLISTPHSGERHVEGARNPLASSAGNIPTREGAATQEFPQAQSSPASNSPTSILAQPLATQASGSTGQVVVARTEPRQNSPGARGIPGAQEHVTMETSKNMNETAELTEQKLPARAVFARQGVSDAPTSTDLAPAELDSTPQPSTTTGAIAQASPLSLRTVERAEALIALHATRLHESGNDSLHVVIKPGPDLHLSLQLSMRDGSVEVQAQLHRGDYELMNRHWSQLQEQLEQRGVRLAPLTQNDSDTGISHFSQHSRREREDQETTRTGAFAEFVIPNTLAPKPVRATTGRQGWESWA